MTIPKVSISCDRFADELADYLEGDVDEPTRAVMDAHAAECAECGSCSPTCVRCASVRRICRSSSPSRDLWTGIAERI